MVEKPRDYLQDQDILKIVKEGSIRRYELAANYLRKSGLTNGIILDVGCSCGYGCRILNNGLPGGVKIIGVDRDSTRLQHAVDNYSQDVLAFVNSNFTQPTPFKNNGNIGAVTCFEVIEHNEKPDELLNGIHGVLAHSGLLFLSTPNGSNVAKKESKKKDHFCSLTQDELVGLLKSNGFSVDHFYGQYPLLGWGVNLSTSHLGVNPSTRPSGGKFQRIINQIPGRPSVFTGFYENPLLIKSSKSLFVIAHKE